MATFCAQTPIVSFPCELATIKTCGNCGSQAKYWCTFTFGVPALRSCNQVECFRAMRDQWRIYVQALSELGQAHLVHQFEELSMSS